MDNLKQCATCKDWFPPTDEYFHSNGTDGRLRGSCKGCYNAGRRGELAEPPDVQPKTSVEKSQRYVVTWAQNATPVNQDFLESLLKYCEKNKAQLVVIAGRYKNKASPWTANLKHDNWWDPLLRPYLFGVPDLGQDDQAVRLQSAKSSSCEGRHAASPNLTLYGDMLIQPTAARPLSGLELFAGQSSAIFGHPKLQHTMVATAKRKWPRSLYTTGAITEKNYTPSKAGRKGEAHHVFGALKVEVDGKRFWVRQLNAEDDTGCFYDIDGYYTPDGFEPFELTGEDDHFVEGIVFGDIHAAKPDKAVLSASFTAQDSIVNALRPKFCVYHDVHDHDTRNHHRMSDFLDKFERAHGDKNNIVFDELIQTADFIDTYTPSFAQPIVIQSNHDEAFDRWLNNADIKQDPLNAELYHEMWLNRIRHYKKHKKWKPAFELWYEITGRSRATFIGRDEEFRLVDIYCNFHGDKGVNGSRGSGLGYSRMGVKSIIGHGHSPFILDGCYGVGVTGSKDQGYNEDSPSTWFHTHVIVYRNGKRSQVSVVDGRWRL